MAGHPKIGDIIEINTAKGKAYAFYTHKNAQFSYLIRVFRDLHAERPKSLEQVVNGAVAFSIFFPLATALNKGIFSVVGNQPVPAYLQPFPVFRDCHPDITNRENDIWWLWDGQKEWKIGKITKEIQSLDYRAICNDTRLIELVEEGYRPENRRWL
jgi:hypothetical protein